MSIDIVAVLGCARSGSTILEGKLQQTADITALGEVTYIWDKGFIRDELCGCGVKFSRCEFWTAVLAESFGKVSAQDAPRFDAAFRAARGGLVDWHTQLGSSPPLDPLFRDVARALYLAAFKIGGERALLDKATPRFAASLQAADVGEILPVQIFRAARPNVYSLKTPKLRPQSQDGSEATMKRAKTVFNAMFRWSLLNHQASNFVRHHKGRKATVCYDFFCTSPDEQLQALIFELGLSPRRAGGVDNWHSVSGNPMRFGADRLQIREDERWKSGLTKLDQFIITLATGWQQKRLEEHSLGYSAEESTLRATTREASLNV
ncbi:MAG: hypothetical protein JWQ97_2158 [Phenylobacterium sp.]|nr:hypothetical protein [Phenylobacterium sp.]